MIHRIVIISMEKSDLFNCTQYHTHVCFIQYCVRQSEMKEKIVNEVRKWCRLLRSLQLGAK